MFEWWGNLIGGRDLVPMPPIVVGLERSCLEDDFERFDDCEKVVCGDVCRREGVGDLMVLYRGLLEDEAFLFDSAGLIGLTLSGRTKIP